MTNGIKDDPGLSSSTQSSQATGGLTMDSSREFSSYPAPSWPSGNPLKVVVTHVDEDGVVSAYASASGKVVCMVICVCVSYS